MEIKTFPCDAAIFCTGGIGAVFGRSTNSVVCTGSAQSAVFQQGVYYANGEFIQVHPTSIPGEDKLRLMSESARGEGGRVWVPRTPGDKRGGQGNPRRPSDSIFLRSGIRSTGTSFHATWLRALFTRLSTSSASALTASRLVYLDVTHIPREVLERKLEGILEIYEKFVGVDPHVEPMKFFRRCITRWADCGWTTRPSYQPAGGLRGRRM